MATSINMQSTGTRDVTYDLISITYHALQGAETYQMYEADAESSGDPEAVAFFRQAQEQNRHLANRAKEMLGERIGKDGLSVGGRERASS